jgi:xanthine dehydrogenase accessory factor
VLGGGHIAKPLVEFGSRTGFSVTVVDDRPMFANKQRFPDAEKVICEDFEKSIGQLNLNRSTFVVIVTRGHRHDITCLRKVLKHDTAYVGLIGSRRRVQSVKEQLVGEGYSKEKLDWVNSPIGLDIGAVTPEEIAIAIIAQVISSKRLSAASKSEKLNWPEFDREVLTEMRKAGCEAKAIVTVISTKGSTPRKAGAKMLVFPDGRTLGSIGGGCSEGAVIRTALDIIRDGGCKIQSVDMTGDIAEDEGMVCGGIMKVLIEAYRG